MAIYEASAITTITTVTAGTPIASIRAVTREMWVREIQLFAITAPTTAVTLALARSTALGTGALTSPTGLGRSPTATAPTGVLITVWGTAPPTVGTAATFFRRFAPAPAVGSGVIWTFSEQTGLIIPGGAAATSEVVLLNGAGGVAPGTWAFNVIWEE